jgi:hypothetical protein
VNLIEMVQARDALAALCAAGDPDAARQLAADLERGKPAHRRCLLRPGRAPYDLLRSVG